MVDDQRGAPVLETVPLTAEFTGLSAAQRPRGLLMSLIQAALRRLFTLRAARVTKCKGPPLPQSAGDPKRYEQTVLRIVSITTAEFPTAARRPAYSVLDGRRLQEAFVVPLPDWREPLAHGHGESNVALDNGKSCRSPNEGGGQRGMVMRISVTGGAGFIESHVVDAYIADGHDVVVLDDLSTERNSKMFTRKRDSISAMSVGKRRRKSSNANARDVLNHHAAQIDVRVSVADRSSDIRINVMASLWDF